MQEEENEKGVQIPLNQTTGKEEVGAEAEEEAAEPTFETLLDTLGHFGKQQRIIFSLLTLSDLMNAMVLMFLVFSSVVPQWKCLEFEGLNMTGIPVGNDRRMMTWGPVDQNERLNITAIVGGTMSDFAFDNATYNFENVCEYNGSKCVRFEYDEGYRGIAVEVGHHLQPIEINTLIVPC
jgi:hypothetical protein